MSASESLHAAINARCQAIRNGSLQPYADQLRANAHEALVTTFPRFCALRGEVALREDIAAFITHHSATRPAFIHLPSEFMLAVRPRLDAQATALIEYEWSLLACEIDPAEIPAPPQTEAGGPAHIAPNPTLHLLAVPFDVQRMDDADPGAAAIHVPFIHAIYRNHLHDVQSRALTRGDVQQLLSLMQADVTAAVDAPQGAWIHTQLACGLLVAAPSPTREIP